MGDPTGANALDNIAAGITQAYKPLHHNNVAMNERKENVSDVSSLPLFHLHFQREDVCNIYFDKFCFSLQFHQQHVFNSYFEGVKAKTPESEVNKEEKAKEMICDFTAKYSQNVENMQYQQMQQFLYFM